ncbi:MAG: hypothetical protein A2Y07_09600 [Planctomycetes bacterium GWF2_50_10]|nr:MAG: hypothetical protein A2Y07_09600 [Planctomycetes bacterium GWF2_50_10]
MKAKRGFTLVEILIVVVILGILAAIVIPQFTEASSEAKVSSLVSNLQTVRSQIELFKIQHNDMFPGECGDATFVEALTMTTDQYGNKDAAGKYGKYLQSFPKNPFVEDDSATVDDESSAVATSGTPGDGSAGWMWVNHEFRSNDAVDANHLTL